MKWSRSDSCKDGDSLLEEHLELTETSVLSSTPPDPTNEELCSSGEHEQDQEPDIDEIVQRHTALLTESSGRRLEDDASEALEAETGADLSERLVEPLQSPFLLVSAEPSTLSILFMCF